MAESAMLIALLVCQRVRFRPNGPTDVLGIMAGFRYSEPRPPFTGYVFLRCTGVAEAAEVAVEAVRLADNVVIGRWTGKSATPMHGPIVMAAIHIDATFPSDGGYEFRAYVGDAMIGATPFGVMALERQNWWAHSQTAECSGGVRRSLRNRRPTHRSR